MTAVLFDIDDTLLTASKEVNVQASEEMFVRVFGVRLNEEMIANSGKTEKGIITEVLTAFAPEILQQVGGIPHEAYSVWGETTREVLAKRPPVILPGILELLETLSADTTVTLGLLTGNSRSRAYAKLQVAGIDGFFTNNQGELQGAFGDEALERKELIKIAQQRLTKENEVCVLVDDSLIGAKMAKEYNLPSIFTATGRSTKEELGKYVPTVFTDFGEGRWKEAISILASFS